MTLALLVKTLHLWNFYLFFFFLSRPSSALISWSSTQVLVDHWGTFCAGGYPNVHFSFFLPGGCGGGLNPRPSDYQADVLPPDQPAPYQSFYCQLHCYRIYQNVFPMAYNITKDYPKGPTILENDVNDDLENIIKATVQKTFAKLLPDAVAEALDSDPKLQSKRI